MNARTGDRSRGLSVESQIRGLGEYLGAKGYYFPVGSSEEDKKALKAAPSNHPEGARGQSAPSPISHLVGPIFLIT